MRVEGLSFKLKTLPGSEIRTVDVTLALPLSGELARGMGADIFDHCFVEGRNDAGRTFEVRDEVSDIAFRMPETLWRVALYMAPDQANASVEIVDAAVTKFRVKRVKDLPLLDARLVVSAALPGSNDVYRLISLLGEAHYIEFTDDQGYLFTSNIADDVRWAVDRIAIRWRDDHHAHSGGRHAGPVRDHREEDPLKTERAASLRTRAVLATAIARLFGTPRATATVIHMPERRAPQVMTSTLIALPTHAEIETDGTRESAGAVRMLSHALASVIERRSGQPTKANEVLSDARFLAEVFCDHYRGISVRRGSAPASEKVD